MEEYGARKANFLWIQSPEELLKEDPTWVPPPKLLRKHLFFLRGILGGIVLEDAQLSVSSTPWKSPMDWGLACHLSPFIGWRASNVFLFQQKLRIVFWICEVNFK